MPRLRKTARIRTAELILMLPASLMILLLLSPITASALPKLTAPAQLMSVAPFPADGFGWSVAAGDGLVAVGAPFSTSSGNVSLFNAATGTLLLKLTSPINTGLDGFGWSVALGDGLLVVGAPLEFSAGHVDAFGYPIQGGNAYVFNASTGGEVSTLTSPNPQYRGFFGQSVSVGDGVIVVGTFENTVGEYDAYVFSAHTGSLLFTLTSPNPQPGGSFGSSVSVGSGLIVVGAPLESSAGRDSSGNAYAFNSHTGSLMLTFTNPDPNPLGVFGGGEFGWSVSVGDGRIVVGAPEDGALGLQPGPGYAFVFSANTGRLVSHLVGDLGPGQFGLSVSAGGGLIVAGAPYETVNGHPEAGAAYVFSTQTAHLVSKLTSPSSLTKAYFGWSVGANLALVVVGAPVPFTPPVYGEPGSAYIFYIKH